MKINVTLSMNGHKTKEEVNFKSLQYRKHELTIDELIEYIRCGYVLSSNFTSEYSTIISQSDRDYVNFVDTHIVMIDVDDSKISMEEFIAKLKNIPTISYTTFSNGIKGYRYRLLYVFDSPISDINVYRSLYNHIISFNNIDLKDNCGVNPCQAIIGTNNIALIYKDETYSITDFDIDEKCKVKYISKKEEKHYSNEIALSEDNYISDYWNLPFNNLIEKYNSKYSFFQHTPLPAVDDDTPYIMLPENYIEIRRYWFDNKVINDNNEVIGRNSVIRKLRDGENRRRKLFINAILRRLMIEDLEFEHLLHNLVNELYFYVDNREDAINKKQLFSIVSNAIKEDLSNYKQLSMKTDKRKYIINDKYCIKYNLSKKKVLSMVKRMINYNEIGNLYDCKLSDKENLEFMKNCGLKISLRTLQNFKKDNNISRRKHKCKVNSIIKKEEKHYSNEIALSDSDNEVSFEESVYVELNNIINLDNYSGKWYEVLNTIGYK